MFMQVSGSYTKLVRVAWQGGSLTIASTLANSKEAAYVQGSKSNAHVLDLCAYKLKATNGGALNLLAFGPGGLFSEEVYYEVQAI
jgi:hypothetical protein